MKKELEKRNNVGVLFYNLRSIEKVQGVFNQ